MALREEMEANGKWLFRWRSYLPLLLLGFSLLGLRHGGDPSGVHRLDRMWEFLCLVVSLCGVGVRMAAVGCAPKGTSGRNVKDQIADTLNTSGMYSIVRHPLYLGNFFVGLGISLFPRMGWFSLLYVLIFWLYYERIMFAEEEFLRLKYGPVYLSWAERTPAFFPNWAMWRAPGLPFSAKWALKREYATVFGVISVYTVLEIAADIFTAKRLVLDKAWVAIFLVSAAVYGIIRWVSKKTNFLSVQGR